MKNYLFIAALMLMGILPAQAIIFWNLDNDANQTDPGTGAPWASVGKVINASDTALSGTAIYLGDGYMLTANHVTMSTNGFSHVSFGGTNIFEIDPSFKGGVRNLGIQVASGIDLAVFRLTSIPDNIPAVSLLSSTNEIFGAEATMVGWGVGRSEASPLESTNVTWGDMSTSAHRWGVNEPLEALTVSYDSYTLDALKTVAGASGDDFVPEGLGDAEGSATVYDSGSALFQKIDNLWVLIGVTVAVDGNGFTAFGNDATTGTGLGAGNYYVRVSSYEPEIMAVVPEPSTIALLSLAGVGFCGYFLKIRTRK